MGTDANRTGTKALFETLVEQRRQRPPARRQNEFESETFDYTDESADKKHATRA